MSVADWVERLARFQEEAHAIFGGIESAKSRAVTLDKSYGELAGLSVKQDDVFRQALRCVENGLFRAAHVMAWAALIDCFHSLVESDGFAQLNSTRPSWNIKSVEQLAEQFTEHALIEAMEIMGVFGRADRKAFHGMLSKRNECAHAGSYLPGFNETLGYISEVFSRLNRLLIKYPGLQL
jgi:hypothetical protein